MRVLVVTLLFSAALLGLLLVVSNALAERLGLSHEDTIVLVFCGSKKTLASGVPMARLMFGAQPGLSLILLPIMIYHPLQLVVCGWLARRFATRRSEDGPSSDADSARITQKHTLAPSQCSSTSDPGAVTPRDNPGSDVAR